MIARHILAALGVTIVLAGGSGSARAQAVAPSTPVVAADPQATALVRRMLKAMGVEAQTDAALAAMLPIMADQMASRMPSLSAADRQALTDVTREMMRDTFTPKMIDAMVPVYAETFTRAELEGLVAFYEGPVGQAAVAKMPRLMERSAVVTRAIIPEMQAELFRRLCERFDCAGAGSKAPVAKPS